MEASVARDLVSDGEWAFFEPFILALRAPNGRKPVDRRRVLDGVFWIARTGAPWRDLPEEWGQVAERLPAVPALDAGRAPGGRHGGTEPQRGRAGRAPDDRQHRGPRSPSGSRLERGSPGQGFGRSRGGFTTRIHLLVNGEALSAIGPRTMPSGLPMRT